VQLTLDAEASGMLDQRQDPRGCYSGLGSGCTATDLAGPRTESHGPPKETGKGKGEEGAAGRVSATLDGLWALVGVWMRRNVVYRLVLLVFLISDIDVSVLILATCCFLVFFYRFFHFWKTVGIKGIRQ
jgi:hypothetical protein